MSATRKQVLGPYELVAPLGAGGMGEVFRARDMRLNREVAIKVLPKDFATDPDRLRRFEQEAKTLASLNHPNVLTIYDTGVYEGSPYLVSELLEGKTLREELGGINAALPVRKATDYALQIAQGLSAAHSKGIIHRDLKPENIFITKDGRVKILDFGLAKLQSDLKSEISNLKSTADPDAPTLVESTEPGKVMGTPAYMSPEQVRGEPADPRSDIFAFGCVLYEMLTGNRAFRRDTPAETMSAVLKEEPPELNGAPSDITPSTERIIRRCLEKQPERRFQTASDLAFALESVNPSRNTPRGPLNELQLESRRARGRLAFAGLALLVAGALALGSWYRKSHEVRSVTWHGRRLDGPPVALGPVVSPDGKQVAFIAMEQGITQVGAMMVDSGEWRLLTTNQTLGSVYGLCWSRDGTELFFDRYIGASMQIFRISRIGGEERPILQNAGNPEVLPDDSLVIARRAEDRLLRLYRFWLSGHRLEPLNAMLARLGFGVPYRLLHGGAEIVFLGWPANSTNQAASTWVLDLKSNHCELLHPDTPSLLLNWASSPYGPGLSDDSIIGVEASGDAYNIVSRKRHKYADSQTLFTLTSVPMKLDVSVDGWVYFDQVERPFELVRSRGSNAVERIPLSASFQAPQVLPLPGDRLLLPSRMAGHDRLVVLSRGQEATPFLISKEESREPMARLGVDRVVCRVGTGSNWVVAIVSIADGSVLQQLKSIPAGSSLRSLAGAPDGKAVYYVAQKTVWVVSVQGGNPKKIRDGDGVAPYPQGDALLIQLNQTDGVRLVRVPLAGTSEEFLPTPPSPFRLVATPLAPNAVGSDGRIALEVDPNSWYWPAAILDPKTGTMELVSKIDADMPQPGWDDQGRVVVAAQFLRSSIWRFSPENQEARK